MTKARPRGILLASFLTTDSEEKITEGLDGLRNRLKDYYKLGARFAKWRGVYIISNSYPSKIAISVNAHALARYSALVQEAGMVPVVEPEVLMDGNHSGEICLNKTSEVKKKCFEELKRKTYIATFFDENTKEGKND